MKNAPLESDPYAHPDEIDVIQMNNFVFSLPGGYIRSHPWYLQDEQYKTSMKDLGVKQGEMSDIRYNQNLRQYFETIDEVVSSFADIQHVEQLVQSCEKNHEMRNPDSELKEILIRTYRALRKLGYTHHDLCA